MQNSLDYNKFFADLNIAGQLKVEEDLGSGYVKLKISESERRQALQDIKCVEDIVIELLRNSRDAQSKNIFIATKKTAEKRRLIYCIDDGRGIPQKFHNLIFQSRVTSKLEDGAKDSYGFHGRGMALFSIKLNVEDIKITYSDLKKGTCVLVEVDLEKIPEKKDQSTLPGIITSDDGYELSGGVNNIIRVLLEFSLNNKNINFYYGSPTQIISTMTQLYNTSMNQNLPGTIEKKIKSLDDFESYVLKNNINITGFGYYADNYNVLEQILKRFYAMDISVRNVQRLMYKEITPLKPLYESIAALNIQGKHTSKSENTNGSIGKTFNLPGLGHTEASSTKNDDDSGLLVNKKAGFGNPADIEKKSRITGRDIRLHDELKLANRFKDEEIRYIINMLEKELINIGSKYFITINSKIEYKKTNNAISFIVNLKQKD